jgi:hypothetical protein
MLSSTKFWFLLLDSTTGQPYESSTADFVSLPPGSVVAELRKLAHHENASILTGVAPSQLLVYKNKASFNRRNNAAKDVGKEEALDPTQSVDGLGSKEDMLVVVVPSPSQPSQQATQTPSFPPCKLPFFNNIRDVTEIDGGSLASFGKNMPSTSLNILYIRECYRTIASSILEVSGIHKAIITGTPGIGKSLFLIFLLWQLVKEGKRVLFIYGSYNIYYDGKGCVFQFEIGGLPSSIDYSFWNDMLWCLFDAKYKNKADLGNLPVEHSTFIVSTSPR